ncbi:8765_t:CDS:2 [Paraglomus brasilianum]|uniref:8765_t:CDS:1 n=1 Tax=Paraglomus brasilianum TaxID=144538 RepID=A0A9N9CVR6_9GLOM|nr:8765_t:CDS:2 [Paraglomus brasilianum]
MKRFGVSYLVGSTKESSKIETTEKDPSSPAAQTDYSILAPTSYNPCPQFPSLTRSNAEFSTDFSNSHSPTMDFQNSAVVTSNQPTTFRQVSSVSFASQPVYLPSEGEQAGTDQTSRYSSYVTQSTPTGYGNSFRRNTIDYGRLSSLYSYASDSSRCEYCEENGGDAEKVRWRSKDDGMNSAASGEGQSVENASKSNNLDFEQSSTVHSGIPLQTNTLSNYSNTSISLLHPTSSSPISSSPISSSLTSHSQIPPSQSPSSQSPSFQIPPPQSPKTSSDIPLQSPTNEQSSTIRQLTWSHSRPFAPPKPPSVIRATTANDTSLAPTQPSALPSQPNSAVKRKDPDTSSETRCLWAACAAAFRSIDELIRHISKLHISGRSKGLFCRWASCSAEKDGSDELISHLCSDHLGTKEYKHLCKWGDCIARFQTFDDLTSHLSEGHVGSGKSKYVCYWEQCERNGRPFSQRQKVMRHMQTHTGDKPYQCNNCNKRFSEANIMTQHMRIHTGERPFKCHYSECGRQFSISGALTIHLRMHTGEKPFQCKFSGCRKRFAESSNLTKHVSCFGLFLFDYLVPVNSHTSDLGYVDAYTHR